MSNEFIAERMIVVTRSQRIHLSEKLDAVFMGALLLFLLALIVGVCAG